MAYPTQIRNVDRGNDFLNYGYVGKYNYALYVPPNTVVLTKTKSLIPEGFVIVNDDLEVETFVPGDGDGITLQGNQFDTTKNWTVYDVAMQRITTNSTGEAYLLYSTSIFDLIDTGGGTAEIAIITEDGIYIITEDGFTLVTE